MSTEPQPALETINRLLPACIHTLNGRVVALEPEVPRCTMMFEAVPEFCHTGTIVQGGFITGMLDGAMAHCCFMLLRSKGLIHIPTLEIKVSFISPGNPGQLRATATPIYMGRSTAFLEAELHQMPDERLVAKASSTVHLRYAKKD